MPGLDDFLDTGATGEEEAAEAARLATEQAETERIAAEESARAADATPANATDAQKGLESAVAAERRKRQEAEEALRLLQEQKNREEEDPYKEEIRRELTQTLDQRLAVERMNLSETFARDKYADFDEKLSVFESMMKETPALFQQMAQQANPAEFMYRTAMNQQKLKEMGDPTEYEKKLREKIRAEVLAEQSAEEKKRSALPGTIATAAGAGGSAAQSWSGPTSIDDLLK